MCGTVLCTLSVLMQSVRDVLRQRAAIFLVRGEGSDAIRAGCAEAKTKTSWRERRGRKMQSVRDVLRQSSMSAACCFAALDAIRAGCSETNGRSLYSNDHAQNNEVNRKESYPIQSLNQIALFYES